MAQIVRVSIRTRKGYHRFWAKVDRRSRLTTLYTPLRDDGDDMSYIDSRGATILPRELVANSLIVSEKPAQMNREYGELEVVR